MTTPAPTTACPCCGYPRAGAACTVCAGEAARLGQRDRLRIGRGNAVLDVLRGVDDVRRSVLALLFERDYIGRLRWPVLVNLLACALLATAGWLWLLPGYTQWFATAHASSEHHGPHLWLFATWLAAGPPLLDLLAGWAQEPLRKATERHMLGRSPDGARRRTPLLERMEELLLAGVAVPLALALTLIPWVGLPLVVLLGAAIAAAVWFQAPMAARGLGQRARLQALAGNRWRALGVGLGLQLAAAVPFLNVLALSGIAAIATTSAYLHFDKQNAAA